MKILMLVVALLLSACVAPQKKASNKDYVTGTTTANYQSISQDLKRGAFESGNYTVEAYLITKPFVKKYHEEMGQKNMDDTKEIERKIAQENKSWVDDQSCFKVEIHTYALATAKVDSWRGKIAQEGKVLGEIQFIGASTIPRVEIGYGYIPSTWHNSFVACGKKADLSKPIMLHLIPQWGGNRVPAAVLEWK